MRRRPSGLVTRTSKDIYTGNRVWYFSSTETLNLNETESTELKQIFCYLLEQNEIACTLLNFCERLRFAAMFFPLSLHSRTPLPIEVYPWTVDRFISRDLYVWSIKAIYISIINNAHRYFAANHRVSIVATLLSIRFYYYQRYIAPYFMLRDCISCSKASGSNIYFSNANIFERMACTSLILTYNVNAITYQSYFVYLFRLFFISSVVNWSSDTDQHIRKIGTYGPEIRRIRNGIYLP